MLRPDNLQELRRPYISFLFRFLPYRCCRLRGERYDVALDGPLEGGLGAWFFLRPLRKNAVQRVLVGRSSAVSLKIFVVPCSRPSN